ncbi:c-type cytochrome [Roseococcus sp. YIM B11640]|uniref:c-type cytochrome n=1 Tax=Roseococcus sp. YIM B11640 TaxID=3133973 RepID=UPI003C7AB8D6
MWRRIAAGALVAAFLSMPASAQDAALVERGRYIVEVIGHCGNCHASRGPDGRPLPGRGLAGGRVLVEGTMRAVIPNITPDRETGIGAWTDADIERAMRQGVRPDGTLIGPPMPIALYRGISDPDMAAIIAYLRSVPPVSNAIAERSSYPFPLQALPPPGAVPPPADDPVSRGAYLVGPLGHCLDCHSSHTADGRIDPAKPGGQGRSFTGPWGVVVARNLTPHPELGLGRWDEAMFARALREEIGGDGRPLMPPMGRGRAWAALTDRDIADIWAYLRSLPPLE